MRIGLFFLLSMITGCIGLDTRDDAIREVKFSIVATTKVVVTDEAGNLVPKGSTARLALLAGEKEPIQTEFLNKYGVKEAKSLVWISSMPSVGNVTNNEVNALAAGTCFLSSTIEGKSITINLTVVANATNDVASVTISAPSTTSLSIGGTSQLTAIAKNMNGTTLNGKTFEWFSENANILTVSSTGLVTAIANGEAEVHAKVEGIKSNSITFSVGSINQLTGTFQNAGGYMAKGTVTAKEQNGKLIVELGSDFSASVALGTFIYLANSTSGSTVKSAGLELGQWSSGPKTFEVSGVTLNQYKYVVVLCKPAGVTFGFAELKP